jgi:serine protease Do
MDTNKKQFGTLLAVVAAISLIAGFAGGMIAQVKLPALRTSGSPSISAHTASTYQPQTTQEAKVISAVSKAKSSVVSIIISKDVPVYQEYLSNPFGGVFGSNSPFGSFLVPQYQQNGTQQQEIGGGTGFIISSDGYILTNKHVVADTTASYTVILNNGTKYTAQVLARDPSQDLAVLKINATGLTPLTLGSSTELQLGQSVIAIGNALGEFSNTVSTGVVSGLNRTITASSDTGSTENLTGVIQTDAAINPGNSGGPLLDLNGNVIGINVAIANNAQGIGFAIPINQAKRDINQVVQSGKISFPFLGVQYEMITSAMAKANNLPVDYGALITAGTGANSVAVVPGSPADKAGISANDIILSVNGTKVNQNNDLVTLINQYNPGDAVTLQVWEKGVTKTVKVTLTTRPNQ